MGRGSVNNSILAAPLAYQMLQVDYCHLTGRSIAGAPGPLCAILVCFSDWSCENSFHLFCP